MESDDEHLPRARDIPFPLPPLDGSLDTAPEFAAMLSTALNAAMQDTDAHLYTPDRSAVGEAKLALINLWLWKTAKGL